MATLAIEVNDAGVIAARALGDGRAQVLVRSPGYVVADGSSLLVGREAQAASRLKPRFHTTRFWEVLDTSALPKPLPTELTHADLVHAHLSDIWNRARRDVERVVLLAPGWYSDEQLGLLLGIARACEMPVTGMVDASLAGALHFDAPQSLHLDLHLHRASAARIARDGRLSRRELGVEAAVGSVALEDAWVTLLARTFVHQTRFDPLHKAEIEQRLYDELPLILDGLDPEEPTTVTMEASGKEHRVELLKEDVVATAMPYYREILALAASLVREGESPPLLVSHRLARLPGLVEILLRDLSREVTPLGMDTPAANVFRSLDRLSHAESEGEALTFVTSLSLADAPLIRPPATPPEKSATPRAPTHVLHAGVAHPIEPVPFSIGSALAEGQRGVELNGDTPGVSKCHASIYRLDGRVVVEDHSRYGCYLNGERVEDKAPLAPGDRLRLGTSDIELQLIEVKD